jgi:uncharacterized protein (DUF2235 family)
MAIFAFDGTTCTPSHLSNVFSMYDAYESRHKFYATGPGSRGIWLSKIIESITGGGAKERLYDAFELWKYWQSKKSRETIIVGFSRGAVMAREFANKVNDAGGTIDFLALYDSVGSFGNPLNMIDRGYRKPIPECVKHCAQALSIHEERFTFRVVRAKPAKNNTTTVINECWFPGVHSDIGGTTPKKGLAANALNWIYQQAMTTNPKQWDPDSVTEAQDTIDCNEQPSENNLSLPRWFLRSLRTRNILIDDSKGC